MTNLNAFSDKLEKKKEQISYTPISRYICGIGL